MSILGSLLYSGLKKGKICIANFSSPSIHLLSVQKMRCNLVFDYLEIVQNDIEFLIDVPCTVQWNRRDKTVAMCLPFPPDKLAGA